MAREDDCPAVKLHEPVQRLRQQGEVTAEVGPAYAEREQRVSGEEDAFLAGVYRYGPHGMPWGLHYSEASVR